MSAQTVSNAVAQRDAGPAALVRESRSWFNTILPSHVDANAFVALTVAYLRKNQALAAVAKNNPQSFMAALSECARLGLVPGDTYHLVPFGSEITGITDYKGEIELIYRAGAVSSVKAEIVCRNDHFRYTTDMDRPEHAPDWFGDRGEIIGAYAYAVMMNGATSKVIVYSRKEIDAVKAVSKTSKRSDSPWVLWYDRMALKTVIHRLENFVPTSAEYRREQLRAAAEVSQQVNSAVRTTARAGNAGTGEVVDAEIVDEPDVPPAQAAAPAAASAPPSDAGGTPGDEQHQALVGVAQQHFRRLGYTDASKQDRLRAATDLVLGTEVPTVSSFNDLTHAELDDLNRTVERLKDRAALTRMLKSGEVPGGE